MTFWTRHHLTIILALGLTLLSAASLFVGVLDLSGTSIDTWELLLISRYRASWLFSWPEWAYPSRDL